MAKLDSLYTAAVAKVEDTKKQRKHYGEEIAQLEAESIELAKTIEKAIEAEDFTAYKAANDKKEKVDFSIAAKKKFMEGMNDISPDDFSEEWKAFSCEYEAEFTKAYNEYTAARKALYKQFAALYDMQKKATLLRQTIAKACGFEDHPLMDADASDYRKIGVFSGLQKDIPALQRPRPYKMSVDTKFFADIGEIPESMDLEMYKVIFCKSLY